MGILLRSEERWLFFYGLPSLFLFFWFSFALFVQWQNPPFTAFRKTELPSRCVREAFRKNVSRQSQGQVLAKPISHENRNPSVSRFLIRSALEGTLTMPKWEDFTENWWARVGVR